MIVTQFHTLILVFYSNNDHEFVNQFLTTFFQHGILHWTCSHPTTNGITGHKNRHHLKVAWAFCFTMHVLKHFWADAVMTSVYLINRMLTYVIDYQTLLHMLSQFHHIPSALTLCLRIFSCVMSMCTQMCIFMLL